jgi:hypothetical protein
MWLTGDPSTQPSQLCWLSSGDSEEYGLPARVATNLQTGFSRIISIVQIGPTCPNQLTINRMANCKANMSPTVQRRSVLGKFYYIGILVPYLTYEDLNLNGQIQSLRTLIEFQASTVQLPPSFRTSEKQLAITPSERSFSYITLRRKEWRKV